MTEQDFQYALIKFVYEIRTFKINEYGQHDKDVPMIIHGEYASINEARKHMADFGDRIPYIGGWKPKENVRWRSEEREFLRMGIFPATRTLVRGSIGDIKNWSSQPSRGKV